VPRAGLQQFFPCFAAAAGRWMHVPHCDVSLTVLATRMVWSGCGLSLVRAPPRSTSERCKSQLAAPLPSSHSRGTQRGDEQLGKRSSKGYACCRFDRDPPGTGWNTDACCTVRRWRNADVLVGTQMLTKGIDRPRVTLARCLAADGLLHRPRSWRAGEQCLRWVAASGRGRSPARGERPGDSGSSRPFPPIIP